MANFDYIPNWLLNHPAWTGTPMWTWTTNAAGTGPLPSMPSYPNLGQFFYNFSNQSSTEEPKEEPPKSLPELKTRHEDKVLKLMESTPKSELLILYKQLYADGIRITDVDEKLRKELAVEWKKLDTPKP